MNKSELVEAVAASANLSKVQAGEAVDAVINTIYAQVKKGEKVTIPGFGTFERRSRAARTARNPRTGEAIKVKAAKVPAFKVGATFKDVVNGTKAAPAAKKPAAKKPAAKPAAKKR